MLLTTLLTWADWPTVTRRGSCLGEATYPIAYDAAYARGYLETRVRRGAITSACLGPRLCSCHDREFLPSLQIRSFESAESYGVERSDLWRVRYLLAAREENTSTTRTNG